MNTPNISNQVVPYAGIRIGINHGIMECISRTQHPPHPIGSKSLVHRSDFPPEPTGLIFAHEDAQTSNGHISHFLSSLLIADDGLVYSTFQPVVANSMAIVFYKPCR